MVDFQHLLDFILEDALKGMGGPKKSTKVSKHTQRKRPSKMKNKAKAIKKSRKKNRKK